MAAGLLADKLEPCKAQPSEVEWIHGKGPLWALGWAAWACRTPIQFLIFYVQIPLTHPENAALRASSCSPSAYPEVPSLSKAFLMGSKMMAS